MNMSRWCWLPVLALCAAGCASSRSGARASSGSATERRANELEARNAELRAELERKRAELQQSYQVMAQAESAAGLNNLACAGVAPASAQVPGLPQSGAVHARFQLRGQPYSMTATFSAPRKAGEWRVSQGTCRVVGP
ncbi:MAG TPA: hypothetical protein VFZ09_06910 [Archangium sp.]|uniref:hypothetical protein n=1 Tax=Archangium sp. TaxID=1872627 RepID=UPI002E32766D|nr:hypothetical protein [Archangium sp.]HEX5745955.1 hypothetical protein [Archangium sp.]